MGAAEYRMGRTLPVLKALPALEATQGQTDVFLSQLPYKCYFEEAAFVGNSLKLCPWVSFRVEVGLRFRAKPLSSELGTYKTVKDRIWS